MEYLKGLINTYTDEAGGLVGAIPEGSYGLSYFVKSKNDTKCKN